ncbi:MAG: endopeptidase La, partial [Deltaproteobacteria bacterium]
KYLVPKQREANGLLEHNITFTDESILFIIRRYTRESGVRNLEREISSICRKVAKDVVANGREHHVEITDEVVSKLLGVPRFRYGLAEEHDQVGLTTGLAWTEVGGELLQIEVAVVPGKGKLTITGKLGDVMQESAHAAMSYVRSRAHRLGLPTDFYQKIDLHIHVPEGAIPKDGPSAGITMATSITSALLRIPVRKDVAMTGEITLRGRVLPIGGLKEKIIAAHRGRIPTCIIPKENEKDIKEIPQKILDDIELILVESMDEVLKNALRLSDPDTLFQYSEETFPEVFPAPQEPEKEVDLSGDVTQH